MSDIPKARRLLYAIRQDLAAVERTLDDIGSQLMVASVLLDREPQIRRAKAKRVVITPAIRQKVLDLHRAVPNMTEAEIAQFCGLRNAGRVSEILNGKRPRLTSKG